MTGRILMSCAVLLFTVAAAMAQGTVPMPGAADPRIRTIIYNPYEVVWLRGHLGYQMMVEFHSAERIENVSIGDSTSWQVTPNRKATLLFLKPTSRDATTNLTVITNLRRYSFQLTATDRSGLDDPNVIFGVRFLYAEEPRIVEVAPPPPPAPAETPVENLNFAYEITGSKRIAPLSVFDDGTATFFQFPDQMETPAIFALDAAGTENLVNFRVRGRHFVVDAVAQSFALRLGRERTVVRNRVFGTAPVPPPPPATPSALTNPAPPTPQAVTAKPPVESAALAAEGAVSSAPDLATVREIAQQAWAAAAATPAGPTPAVAAPAIQPRAPALIPGLRETRTESAPGPLQPFIQIGAFSTNEKANEIASSLRGFSPSVSTVVSGGRSLYRVRLGPWSGPAEVNQVLDRVRALGFADARAVSEPSVGEPIYLPASFTNRKETGDYTDQRAAALVEDRDGAQTEGQP